MLAITSPPNLSEVGNQFIVTWDLNDLTANEQYFINMIPYSGS